VKRDANRGMTLVELMITLIISSVIAASTFVFFAGQQRIYDTQTKVLNIQQNVWAAMEVLTRYTRAAGSGMFECLHPASYANTAGAGGGRLPSSSPSPGPLSPSLAVAPDAGLRAYNAATGLSQRIPPLWIVDNSDADANVATNTDILTVAFGSQTSGTDTDADLGLDFSDTSPGNPITLKLANASNMFRGGEFVLLLIKPSWTYGNDPKPDRGCTMLQITDYAANSTALRHSSVSISGMTWNPPTNQGGMLPSSAGYGASTTGVRNFGSLAWLRFFIRQDAVTGIPNLMLQQLHRGGVDGQAQVLAEGIEDLQISFACDTGSLGDYSLTKINGQLDEGSDDASKQRDEWWNNVPNDDLPGIADQGYCNLPTAIRLTLVARSLSPDDLVDPTVTGNGPLDVENHRYSTPRPTDRYRRRVLSTTVYPRNNKPL
jgi:prepilin-type N-terminal cleavage/methylation domain-containing protein